MEKINTYKEFADEEILKRLQLIPRHNGTKDSMLRQLNIAGRTITEMDKALLKTAADYIQQHNLTEEESGLIYEINAASLIALISRANLPAGLL